MIVIYLLNFNQFYKVDIIFQFLHINDDIYISWKYYKYTKRILLTIYWKLL